MLPSISVISEEQHQLHFMDEKMNKSFLGSRTQAVGGGPGRGSHSCWTLRARALLRLVQTWLTSTRLRPVPQVLP